MPTRFEYGDGTWDEPEFYLPRLIGVKLAVLVVIVLLYLCISYQLAKHMNPIAVDLGVAHAEAAAMLAVFGGADTTVTITIGHKDYDLTRQMVAHSHMFIACWRAVLWQIECGTIWAAAFVCAPTIFKSGALKAWDVWDYLHPEPRRARPLREPAAAPYTPPPPSHPYFSSEPYREELNEPEPAILPPPAEEAVFPVLEVRKRPRKAKKASPSEDDNPRPPSPPSAPLVQPGQVRKRRKPEG